MTTVGAAKEKKWNTGKFDKSKKKRIEENNKVSEDGFNGGKHCLYKSNL